MALTLRTLGGLTTAEIARAFLTTEATMAQRLVRAKAQDPRRRHPLRGARRPSSSPSGSPSVLATLYLIFNEGYFASGADALIRTELARRGDPPGARAGRDSARASPRRGPCWR